MTSRRIDNTAPANTLTDPGAVLTGTKTIAATVSDGGSGLASTALSYRASGAGSWTALCSAASCSLNTATLADGLYDFRSVCHRRGRQLEHVHRQLPRASTTPRRPRR